MRYIEVKFPKDDLLPYLLGEIGFESFIEEDNHLLAYIQQQDFNEEVLKQFGKPYTWKVAEYKDWNEEWERQGFDPIDIDGKIIIHDTISSTHSMEGLTDRISIAIDARQAFGTGTHQTTRMMLRQLLTVLNSKLSTDNSQLSLLDCGCGTGILSIAASKLGFHKVVGYDIDEWSVDNSIHNAKLNNVTNCCFLQGNASLLAKENRVIGPFDVVMANINRNILLNDVPLFVGQMHEDSLLIVSGFYQEDAQIITTAFAKYGLGMVRILSDDNWTSILFTLSH